MFRELGKVSNKICFIVEYYTMVVWVDTNNGCKITLWWYGWKFTKRWKTHSNRTHCPDSAQR